MDADHFWPLLACVAVFCWTVVAAHARPAWVVTGAIGLFVSEAIFGAAPGVEVAGVVVYARDAVFAAILTAGVVRLAMSGVPPKPSGSARWAWWSLLLLAFVSAVRGIHSYGVNLAGNDLRPAFYLVAGVVGLAARRDGRTSVRDIVDVWIGAALVLTAVGFGRTLGLTIGLPIGEQAFLNGRPLYAWHALFIAQAALLAFFAVPLKSRWAGAPGLPYVFLSGVLLFRHRTVWATMLVAIVAMWTMLRPERAGDDRRSGRHWAGVLVAAGALALILLTGKGSELERNLTATTAGTTSQGSTFLWRVEGWKALLDNQGADPQELVLGIPYGAGYHREVFDAEVEYSPHSWYVQTISRVGVLGCGLLVLALVDLFRRGRSSGAFPRNLGALLVLSTAVYGIAYYPPEVQGILLGLVALATRHSPTKAGPEEAPEAVPTTTPRLDVAPVGA